MIREHAVYRELAVEAEWRRTSYCAFVMEEVTFEEIDAIRSRLQHQHPYGSDRFRSTIEAQLGRTVGPRKIGRPHKTPDSAATIEDQESLL